MRLKATITLYAGGKGSGCNPAVADPRCGRPYAGERHTPKQIQDVLNSYHSIFPTAAKQWRNLVGKYGVVEGRVKSSSSLSEKLIRTNYSLSKVADGMGLRVTTDSLQNLYKAVSDIRSTYKITEEDNKINNPTGGIYRAYHFTAEIEGKPTELQVRTKNQSRLAIWMHDTVYKGSLRDCGECKDYAAAVSNHLYAIDRGMRVGKLPNCPEEMANNCFSMKLPYVEKPLRV